MARKPDLPPLLLAVPPQLPPALPASFRIETDFSTDAQWRWRNVWRGTVIKTHGGAAQVAGTPDLLGCLAGRFVAIELKQPRNRPTPRQYKRLREWQASGAVAGWVTSLAELDGLLVRAWDPPGWANPQLDRSVEESEAPLVGAGTA